MMSSDFPTAIGADRLRKAVEAETCRRSLAEFVKKAWHVVEPGTKLVWGQHLDVICSHLQAVTDGRIKRLIINIPPGHCKSLLVSVFWPAWEWIDNPCLRSLYGSHDPRLSARDAVRTRDLVTSSWYRKTFDPRWNMKKDQNAKGFFENDQHGLRWTFGMGGQVTGWRGDKVCLSWETPITTDRGVLPIGQIVENQILCRVLSYQHSSKSYCWRGIIGFESSGGRPSVRVRCSAGRSFEATTNHPVFVIGRGYVAAGELSPGDRVITDDRALQDLLKTNRACSRTSREDKKRTLLRDGLLKPRSVRSGQYSVGRRQGRGDLRAVRQDTNGKAVGNRTDNLSDSILFGGLSSSRLPRKSTQTLGQPNWGLRSLRWNLSSSQGRSRDETILFGALRQYRSLHRYLRDQEWLLRSRQLQRNVSSGIPQASELDPKTRPPCLPFLQANLERSGLRAQRASHRLQQAEQRPEQSHDGLPTVSRWTARFTSPSPRVDEAVVEVIEQVPTPARVYNLNVEVDHNYFAAGILVHNCVDDPLDAKNQFNAGVKDLNEFVWDNKLSSRVNNPQEARFVLVMQRLADDDLAGRLLKRTVELVDTEGNPLIGKDGEPMVDAKGRPLREPEYDHVCLATEFEPEKRTTTSIGWTDWRTEPGELMFPEFFNRQVVERTKQTLGAQGFAGQHQQSPVASGGNLFRGIWFTNRLWHWDDVIPGAVRLTREGRPADLILLANCSIFATVDVAAGENSGNDFTVYAVWGVTPANDILLLAEVRDRLSNPESIRQAKSLKVAWPRISHFVVEQNGVGLPLVQQMLAQGIPVTPISVNRDKEARATSAVVYAEQGKVYIPDPDDNPWMTAWLQEVTMFPNGGHEDRVDCFTLAAEQVFSGAVAIPGTATVIDTSANALHRDRGTNHQVLGTGVRRFGAGRR